MEDRSGVSPGARSARDADLPVDTIVARSTAAGLGAIAVVRLSGPEADRILWTLAPELEGRGPPPRTATLTAIHAPVDGALLDRALVTRFPGPESYTGEDLVEISCHGGWLVPSLILDACLDAGARQAEPGEFTRRAYLRGRMDLVQAEAVADLIHARSRALHRAAVGQLERGLSARISELREALLRIEALLAHHIDFPEEDDAPVPIERIAAEAEALVARLVRMLETAPEGELLREGALAVLAGRPNVGKSSLYNALIGEERAIVTEEPGTTRDALETSVELGGFPFRIVDTAGLRDTEARIERLGIEVTRRYLERADVVLFCTEAGRGLDREEEAFLRGLGDRPFVLLETKADLDGARSDGGHGDDGAMDGRLVAKDGGGWTRRVRISTLSGEGLGTLRTLLPRMVYAGLVEADADLPVLTRRRHARALERARDEMAAFGRALAEGVPAEIAAQHLGTAEAALEEVLGVISTEDVLEVVFREFCVGK